MYPNWCIYHLIVHSQFSEPHLCRKRHQRMRDKDNYSRSASQHERQFCKIMTRAVASKMKTETLASDILLSVFDVFSHLNQPKNLEGEFNHAHCPSHDLFFWEWDCPDDRPLPTEANKKELISKRDSKTKIKTNSTVAHKMVLFEGRKPKNTTNGLNSPAMQDNSFKVN